MAGPRCAGLGWPMGLASATPEWALVVDDDRRAQLQPIAVIKRRIVICTLPAAHVESLSFSLIFSLSLSLYLFLSFSLPLVSHSYRTRRASLYIRHIVYRPNQPQRATSPVFLFFIRDLALFAVLWKSEKDGQVDSRVECIRVDLSPAGTAGHSDQQHCHPDRSRRRPLRSCVAVPLRRSRRPRTGMPARLSWTALTLLCSALHCPPLPL